MRMFCMPGSMTFSSGGLVACLRQTNRAIRCNKKYCGDSGYAGTRLPQRESLPQPHTGTAEIADCQSKTRKQHICMNLAGYPGKNKAKPAISSRIRLIHYNLSATVPPVYHLTTARHSWHRFFLTWHSGEQFDRKAALDPWQ